MALTQDGMPDDMDENAVPNSADRALARLSRGLRPLVELTTLVAKQAGLIALTFAIVWASLHAYRNRDTVRLLSFDVSGATANLTAARPIEVEFHRALEDVAAGSLTDMDVVELASDTVLPPVSIPGTSFSLESVLNFVQQLPFFRQPEVRGALTGHDGAFQVWLEYRGRDGKVQIIRTQPKNLDDALLEAAESLYGVTRPIGLAAYLYRRGGERSLEVIQDILSAEANRSPGDDAKAYRLWGLVLRDEEDWEGARAKFEEAIERWNDQHPHRAIPPRHSRRRSPDAFLASLYVDLGHTALWRQHWSEAVESYEKAARSAPRWAVPHRFLGDALKGRQDLDAAAREYHQAVARDRFYIEAWNGLGRTFLAKGDYDHAIRAYTTAQQLHLKRDRAAALSYSELGDALREQGYRDAAGAQYQRAMEIDPSFEEERPDWRFASACEVPPDDGTRTDISFRCLGTLPPAYATDLVANRGGALAP